MITAGSPVDRRCRTASDGDNRVTFHGSHLDAVPQIRRIADDDREAFGELFDRCSPLVSRRLRRQVSDGHRAAGVLAGAFVEVWWLAGCHVDDGTDVVVWIDQITQRRGRGQPAGLSAAIRAAPGVGLLGALWAQGVEMELAGLLKRRLPPLSDRSVR